MIRPCNEKDLEAIYEIINDAARAYKGVIPEDLYKEPYMTKDELKQEIDAGVKFWGYEENNELLGVMGIQDVKDVTLIRHAYVKTARQNQGIGGKLLSHLLKQTNKPVLIGTWANASWAIRFYEKHGFRLVSSEEKDKLLRKYWSIPERQIEASVVLANHKWFQKRSRLVNE
uniref:GNAT family N-acetyltransferase n=1 Tax=Geoglobus ahangari TaxID=113653 RepID=A0A7C3YEN1_9EURY